LSAVTVPPHRPDPRRAAPRRGLARAGSRRHRPGPLAPRRPAGPGMIRVAYFAPLLYTGGTQRHLQQVVRHLDPRRFTVHVYTLRPGGEIADELRATGVPV